MEDDAEMVLGNSERVGDLAVGKVVTGAQQQCTPLTLGQVLQGIQQLLLDLRGTGTLFNLKIGCAKP
jgi:hypothetical protein